ncbi:MAG: CotH kinase family protein [Crocinitomicaceae bacterium]
MKLSFCSLICISLTLGLNGSAQDFYDLTTIQSIDIVFAQSNWDQLLDAEKAGNEDYIMAASVSINGTIFDSVGVKYKGNSTYNANQDKNPFHIELDTYKDQDYKGYKDIKLSNVAKDPSFLREVLSYQIIRQYMDAPKSNYANVTVNGTLIGLYSSSEAISKTFLSDRFDSKNNTFVKCNPIAGAGPQSTDLPDLVYFGTDSADYEDAYELKSDIAWADLIAFCDTLNNNISGIESVLDVDRAIWMLALDNVLVNLDSYIGAFTQNYYLYQSDFNQFIPIIWDLNESLGVFSMTGTSNLNNTTSKAQMSHLLHENDTGFPLISQLMSVPLYKRMYLAHIKTILLENFDNGSYVTTAQTLQTLITSSVQADNNKFFTNANFSSNLNSDINTGGGGPGGGGPGSGSYPGITNLMNARNTYLLAQSDFTTIEPTISNVAPSNTSPNIYDVVTVTATITNENSAYIGYRDNKYAPFTRTLMFDDGNHNDGAANDGVYGFELTMSNTMIQYYIYADNSDIGKFSPVRAEYEYHIIETFAPPVGDLVINEFQADNNSTKADQDGEFDDWIELYNNTNASIDLGDYYLSDNVNNVLQWVFPAGTSIAANGYLIIWCDKDTTQVGLHTNFKLSAGGETVFLSDDSGTLLDQISYGEQSEDLSYARFPNGTGAFQEMFPTFNSINVDVTGIESNYTYSTFNMFPNPTNTVLTIKLEDIDNSIEQIVIYNAVGQKMLQVNVSGTNNLDVSTWPKGIYLVMASNTTKKLIIN